MLDDDMKESVTNTFKHQPKTLYEKGIALLVVDPVLAGKSYSIVDRSGI